MSGQLTEMLKGALEGLVLSLLAGKPAHGSAITSQLRDMGFGDIAEGTVYALLVRVEKRGLTDVERVPSPQGPPRKIYSLTPDGEAHLEEFWTNWRFLAVRLEALQPKETHR